MYKLINNVRLVLLVIITLVLAGVFSYNTLPRELNPEVKIPVVNIVTTLPGASPADVEKLITEKIEKEVASISGLDTLSSSSQNSLSIVTAQFISSQDPDKALDKVKEKVDLVTDLPDDANEPNVAKLDFNEQPVLQVAITGDINRHALSQVGDKIADTLENSSRIKRVDIAGDPEEEIAIDIKPETLSTYNIDPGQVQAAIATNNLSFPAGSIEVSGLNYTLSVGREYTTIEQVRNQNLNVSGQTIPLSQIANIYYRSKDTDRLVFARQDNGQRVTAVELSIYKSESSAAIETADTATQIIAEELEGYEDLESTTILDLSKDIQESFAELSGNFTSTIILVFLVLFAFLGFRQAAIASLSIPLTFLSAFTIMSVIGISLNFLSLFSLLLALGLVVDDAIVIVQAASRYGKKFTPIEAGLLVYRDFVVPIWTTTITTVWAFAPLLLSTGIIGEFIKSIPVVVTATLLSSTTIAVLLNIPLTTVFADLKLPGRVKVFLTILAGIAGGLLVKSAAGASALAPLALITYGVILFTLLKGRKSVSKALKTNLKQNTKLISLQKNIEKRELLEKGVLDFSVITKRYARLLTSIIESKKNRRITYGLTLLFLLVSFSFLPTGLLKNEFFPKTDSENLYVNIELPNGTPVEKTRAALETVEEQLTKQDNIASLVSSSGFSFDENTGGSNGSNFANVAITLTPEEDRNISSSDIASNLREDLSGIKEADITVAELSGGPPAGADLQINIKGDDLVVLEQISQDFQNIVKDIEGAINTQSSLKLSPGEIKVNFDDKKLAAKGLSSVQVGTFLRTAISGTEASTISLGGQDQDITITLSPDSLSLSNLQNLQLPAQMGSYTLSQVADFSLENSPVSIAREDQKRVVRVTASAAKGTPAQTLFASFEEAANEYEMPAGYTWDVGGANEENNKSVQSIIQAMGLSAILILITMVLQLESFRKAFLVMVVIPLAVAGVFFNFTIIGIPLSFPALIGVLALFGIVVNNSIMLVEKINQNLKIGFKTKDAIVDACSSRIEPIFLTSLTTSAGLLPITLSDPFWRGLGGAIIAGLSVSGILILVLLPTLYYEVFNPNKE